MNVETITMPKTEAVAKIAAYRKFLKSRANEEYEAALRGYEELAKGTPLIDPFQAIREAGWGEKFRPRLAIARADQKTIRLTHRTQISQTEAGHWVTRATGVFFNAGQLTLRSKDGQIAVENMPPTAWVDHIPDAKAIVPMIPADVYPKRGHGSPKDWYILWEAEWQNVPPKDPLLLKPIGGNLYAVLAAWDLTELERKIIARR